MIFAAGKTRIPVLLVLSTLAFAAFFAACTSSAAPVQETLLTYTGYSWQDESKGVTLEAAKQKIETTLVLDSKGTIRQASMDFLVLSNGVWTSRLADVESLSVDFSVAPVAAVADPYKAGTSMFRIKANDLMSLYGVAVDADGTVAGFIVDPMTRFQFEFKFAPGFDFARPIADLTVESGLFVPTVRTSSSGLMKPKSWTALAGLSIFDYSPYSHVLNLRGDLSGLDASASIGTLLEAMGVTFAAERPQAMAPVHGYTGQGGWAGNYAAIADYLVGKNANELKSLIDWTYAQYAGNINDDNFFGLSAVAGATRTVQDSYSTVSGATVRVSRESTSYQRALVAAGILAESEVIKGRF